MKEKYVCNWCRTPTFAPGFCPVCLKKVKTLEYRYGLPISEIGRRGISPTVLPVESKPRKYFAIPVSESVSGRNKIGNLSETR